MRVLLIFIVIVLPVLALLVNLTTNAGFLSLLVAHVIAFFVGRLAAEIAIDIDEYLTDNKQ